MDNLFFIISPLLVMLACNLVAKETIIRIKSEWRWVPNLLFFWFLLSIFIFINHTDIFKYFIVTLDNWWVGLLAFLVGFIPLPILIFHKHLLRPTSIFIAWVLFAIINPFFEELFWRGFVINSTESWPVLISILYSSLLFSLNHKIAWESISPLMGDNAVLLSTFIMGVVWSLSIIYCHTIYWAIISHCLVDLFNLAVPVYMNLYKPRHKMSKKLIND